MGLPKAAFVALMIWAAATLVFNVVAILLFQWQYNVWDSPVAGLFVLLAGTIFTSAVLGGLIVVYQWRFRK